jgi:hypothetical protein
MINFRKHIISHQHTHCQNCGHATTAPYCPKCGQRRQDRFNFSYLFDEITALLNYDKGIFFTFRHLLLHPQITVLTYLKGATKKYYPPLPYFMLAMTIFLFFGGLHQVLEAEGWSSGKMFVFDETAGKTELQNYYAKQKQTLKANLQLADTTLNSVYHSKPELVNGEIALKIGDTTVVEPNFNYTKTLRDYLALELEAEKAYNDLSDKVLRSQLLIYTSYYLTPFYLALLVFVLYFTTKLYFTEHLIIQTYITAQLVWYLNIGLAIGFIAKYLINFIHKDFQYSQYPTIMINLMMGVILFLIAYYYYFSLRCYQQTWWLILLKCFILLPLLMLIVLFVFLGGHYLLVGKSL